MPITVRLPPRVEQELADYCAAHKVTRSEAVKRALEQLLKRSAGQRSPYDLGKDFFERKGSLTRDIGMQSKRLLRERFRGKLR